jgi:UDP-glucose 4-epimerase
MAFLVTGSAGHLGEALMRMLRARGEDARGLDIRPSPFTDVVGSVADQQVVGEAMRGIRAVLHTATLHKPHLVTHTKHRFVETNVGGTLHLLEAAVAAGVRAFVQTSTTSVFGDAMVPRPGSPAVWIDESVVPQPKNVYGATKLAAEHLCRIVARESSMPVVVLRTSRFFPEDDDNAAVRQAFARDNVQALELLYRRADLADVAAAHLAAIDRAPAIGFGTFIVSATTAFTRADLAILAGDARSVILDRFPDAEALFDERGWRFFPAIGRVYDNRLARETLGWQPRYDFRHLLDCLAAGRDFRSPLALEVGTKGYHDQVFVEGPYPV